MSLAKKMSFNWPFSTLCFIVLPFEVKKTLLLSTLQVSEIPRFHFISAYKLAAPLLSFYLSYNNLPMQPMVPITQDCFQPLPLDFYNFINYVISPQVIKGNDFSRNFTIALHNSPSFEPWIKFFANSQIATQIIDFHHDNVLYLSASYCLGQDWEIRP